MNSFNFPVIDFNDTVYHTPLEALGDQQLTDRSGWRTRPDAETGGYVFEHQSPRSGGYTVIGTGETEDRAVQDAWENFCSSRHGQDACFDDLETLQRVLDQSADDPEAWQIVARKLEAIAASLRAQAGKTTVPE